MTPRLAALITAIFLAALLRLVPHPPNFSPIAAMALFGGAYLPKRWLAFAAPFGALLLSDLVIGFHALMPIVYGSVALVVCLGWLLERRRTAGRVALAATAGSVLFFLLTNFGVWAFGDMYPKTAAGLAASYTAAIPFFQNALAGDLFFTALLFGGFTLAEHMLPALRQSRRLRTA